MTMKKIGKKKVVTARSKLPELEAMMLSKLDPSSRAKFEQLKGLKPEASPIVEPTTTVGKSPWVIPVVIERTSSANGSDCLPNFTVQPQDDVDGYKIKPNAPASSNLRVKDPNPGKVTYSQSVHALTKTESESSVQSQALRSTIEPNEIFDPELINLCSNQPQLDQPLAKNLAPRHMDDVAWQDFTSYKLILNKPSYSPYYPMPGLPVTVESSLDELPGGIPQGSIGNDPFFMDFYRIVLESNGFNRIPWDTIHNDTRPNILRFFSETHARAIGAAGLWSKLFLMYYAITNETERSRFLKNIVPPDPGQMEIILTYLRKVTVPSGQPIPPPVEMSETFNDNLFRLYYRVKDRNNAHLTYGDSIKSCLPYNYAQIPEVLHNFLVATWPEVVSRALQQWEKVYDSDYETLMAGLFRRKPMDYPFAVTQFEHVNFGIRLTHRQEWRPLGLQRGEIVRTLPLGPKQTQKISTKQISRSKSSTSTERNRESESTTETNQTVKDSSDVIAEAAKSFGWKLEAEASYSSPLNAGGPGIKISGGMNGSEQSSSKSTSQHLSETMQKVSSKLRTQSKVVVSTEGESTFEQNLTSEIQNPNDEIAVTFIYSKLQRQYEVLTQLYAIDNVLCIAEEVPDPWEVSEEWVCKHGWILTNCLLDESFRPGLESILSGIPPMPLNSTAQGKLDLAMDSATRGIEKLASGTGQTSLAQVDVVQEAQRAYRESQKEMNRAQSEIDSIRVRSQRFLEHLRENILHYCHEIWRLENPEQRLLRYEKRQLKVPSQWVFVPEGGVRVDVTASTLAGFRSTGLRGTFIPHPTNPAYVPLIDLISPFAPPSFSGNYAIFEMKSGGDLRYDSTNDLFPILNLLQSLYENPARPGEILDPCFRETQELVKIENGSNPDGLPLEIDSQSRELMVDMVPSLRAKFLNTPIDQREVFMKGPVDTFKPYYVEFRYRKKFARRLLVDTNNLVVDIERGSGTVLEQFKVLHRAFDVKKAAAESASAALDFKRRQLLIDAGRFGDPSIEKVIAVSNVNGLTVNVDPGN